MEKTHAVILFFFYYILPSIVIFFMYGSVIYTMYKKAKESTGNNYKLNYKTMKIRHSGRDTTASGDHFPFTVLKLN